MTNVPSIWRHFILHTLCTGAFLSFFLGGGCFHPTQVQPAQAEDKPPNEVLLSFSRRGQLIGPVQVANKKEVLKFVRLAKRKQALNPTKVCNGLCPKKTPQECKVSYVGQCKASCEGLIPLKVRDICDVLKDVEDEDNVERKKNCIASYTQKLKGECQSVCQRLVANNDSFTQSTCKGILAHTCASTQHGDVQTQAKCQQIAPAVLCSLSYSPAGLKVYNEECHKPHGECVKACKTAMTRARSAAHQTQSHPMCTDANQDVICTTVAKEACQRPRLSIPAQRMQKARKAPTQERSACETRAKHSCIATMKEKVCKDERALPCSNLWLEVYTSDIEGKSSHQRNKRMFRAEAKHPAVSPFPTNTGGTIPPVTSRNRPLQGVPVTNFCEVKVDLKRLLLEENKQKNIQNIEHVKGNVLVHYRWVLWKNGSPRASGARGVIPVGDKVRVISLDRLGNPLIAPPHITENHYVVVTLTGPYPNKIKRPSYKIELSGKAIRLRVANIYTRGLPSGGARTNAESSLNPQKTMDFTGEDLKSSNTWFVFSRLPGGYRYYVTVTVNANEATNPKKAQQQATPPSNGGKSKKAENGGGAAGGNASTGGNSSGDSSPERNENSGSSKSTKHSFFVYPVYRFRPQLGVVVSFSTTGSKIRPNLFNSPVQYSSKGGFLSATPEPVSASFLIGTLIYLHERDIYDPHCPVGVGILLGMGANERIFRDYYLGIGLEIRGAAVISVGFRFTLSEQLPEGLTAGMPYDGTIGTLPIRPTVGGFVSLTFDPIILVTALGDYIQERIAKWSKPKSN